MGSKLWEPGWGGRGPGARGLPRVAGEVDCGAKGEGCRQDQSAVGRLPGEGARLGWGQQGSSQLPAHILGRKAKDPPSSEPGDGSGTPRSPPQPEVIL